MPHSMLEADSNYLVVTFAFSSKEFNVDVLKKFIGLHDFKGKLIVDALR